MEMDSTPSQSPQVGGSAVESADKTAGDNKAPTSAAHKRTYQACLPCRRRKVRCDLGSVDEPGDPPCQRCRREKKECVFSETRRKRKPEDEGGPGDFGDEYDARSKRLSIAGDGSFDMVGLPTHDQNIRGPPDIDAAGITFDGMRRNGASRNLDNPAASLLFSDPIHQSGDAFNMLVDAAGRVQQAGPMKQDPENRSGPTSTHMARKASAALPGGGMSPAIDPAIIEMQGNFTTQLDPDLSDALQAWSRVRFVQAGWFTPEEGIAYIKYFYDHLSPLSPVIPPDFSSLSSHASLLNEEPMLTVTLLTIASRYLGLKGSGGASRTFWIHDKLWDYLQSMITRMFWGQEQFGGGFCGAGNAKTEESEARRRGLRSLGTVESLLLLSDWLPRSMHFPPGDDGDELLIPPGNFTDIFQPLRRTVQIGWTEPAIRSDRMVWSLVSIAYSLALELGVFDSLIDKGSWCPGPQTKTSYASERADRAGRMLFVYVTQACGRLGYPNMMPQQGTETNLDFLKMDVPPGKYSGPYGSVTTIDKVQRAWAELTALIRLSNTELFESQQRTQQSIQSGAYIDYIEKFNPLLAIWKGRFEQTDIPPKARTLLLMEYEYARTFINSLSVQAVLEQIRDEHKDVDNQEPSSAQTPPALVSSKTVDVKKQNEPYIKEVVDASRSILDLALKGLRSDGGLRHAPVRTHFRILSGAMFLLKTFALGGKENEVLKSLKLLTDITKALKDSVPDDSHLSLRVAELLFSLTTSIKAKFVRLSVRGPKRTSNQGRPSTSHTSVPNSTGTPASGSKTTTVNDHRRTNSFTSSMNSFNNIQIRNVDHNDSNITIMPPSEYLHHNSGGYDPAMYNPGASSPHSTGVYSPATVTANMNGNSPTDSPVLGSATIARQRQVPFSPTQTPTASTAPPQPFSPASTGSHQDYSWLAIDLSLINAQSQGASLSGQGTGANIQTYNNGNTGGNTGQAGSNTGSNIALGDRGTTPFGTTGAWNGGAFGPEISDNLGWLEVFGAVGNLGFDDSLGTGLGPFDRP